MTVYIDHARRRYGRLRLSHMTADTRAELVAMTRAIGLCPRRDVHRDHVDVGEGKRKAAIRAGAVPVTTRTLARMQGHYRRHGRLPKPSEATRGSHA